jgi:plastocyanin
LSHRLVDHNEFVAVELLAMLAKKETKMRQMKWLLPLLLLCAAPALGATRGVSIGPYCSNALTSCFFPGSLTISVGDSVTFTKEGDIFFDAVNNVVADDGSFRCARGCDGEGGDGTPAGIWTFTRRFTTPGAVGYHDELSHASGVIIVGAPSALPFAIGPGITGAWYDPAQNGHGLFVEILPGNRVFVGWFTFNPAGTQQAWFVGTGTYSGNTAIITPVSLPTGGRWIPNFDPGQIVNNFWGTLTFAFSDCNHGTVDFDSVLGYGTGSMNLTRLTQPAGLTCP